MSSFLIFACDCGVRGFSSLALWYPLYLQLCIQIYTFVSFYFENGQLYKNVTKCYIFDFFVFSISINLTRTSQKIVSFSLLSSNDFRSRFYYFRFNVLRFFFVSFLFVCVLYLSLYFTFGFLPYNFFISNFLSYKKL